MMQSNDTKSENLDKDVAEIRASARQNGWNESPGSGPCKLMTKVRDLIKVDL